MASTTSHKKNHNKDTKKESRKDSYLTRDDEPNHVIAVDESENTERAFLWACENYPESHRFLITHGKYVPTSFTGKVPPTGHDLDEEERIETNHKRVFEKYNSLCKANNRACEFHSVDFLTANDLGKKICDVAKRTHSKSVVCSSRDLGKFGKVMLGSTSDTLLSDCDSSVTVVKPQH